MYSFVKITPLEYPTHLTIPIFSIDFISLISFITFSPNNILSK